MKLAVLQTDIAGSTEISEKLGDRAASTLWAKHDHTARELLIAWAGREIDKSDGFLLTFNRTSEAVGFAMAYNLALAEMQPPLKARTGIHFAEVAVRANAGEHVSRGAKPAELDGIAKSLTARICSLCLAGQILMTAEAVTTLSPTTLRVQPHGHWRLKGLEDPVELFGIDEADALLVPPQDSDKAYRVVWSEGNWLPARDTKGTLPAERDLFIGRERDLKSLVRRFGLGQRLVSILGPGGMGKTRLARRFAHLWAGDFSGGVWFCDLSQARTLDGLLQAVALGLEIPLGREDPVSHLGRALANRGRCLLILDNFEQLVEYAESTVAPWLERARDASVLVTSRQLLGIAGEQAFWIDSLSLAEGIELFIKRSEMGGRALGNDDRRAVGQLANLLDGLPLAIELAAARARMMSPKKLLDRLGPRLELSNRSAKGRSRQSTLRTTFDWSWDLLEQAEKIALAQLTVFESGACLEAAESVVKIPREVGSDSPIDLLHSLLDKSLIKLGAFDRYEMLTTVQEYAREHLCSPGRFAGSGLDASRLARRRHFEFFSRLGRGRAVANGAIELDNLTMACLRSVEEHAIEDAVGSLEASWEALRLRGPFKLGIALSKAVAALVPRGTLASARTNLIAGNVHRACGHFSESETHLKAALGDATAHSDSVLAARISAFLGNLYVDAGRNSEGQAAFDTALRSVDKIKHPVLMCEILIGLGNLNEHMGRLNDAGRYFQDALAAARSANDRRWEGGSLGNLGLLMANQGLVREARNYYEESLKIVREVGDRQWEGNTLCNLGHLHHIQGRTTEAMTALTDALSLARSLGHAQLECVVLCNLGLVQQERNNASQAVELFAAAAEVARNFGDRRSEGQCLTYAGLAHARDGRLEDAQLCLATAEQLLTQVGDDLGLGLLMCSKAEAAHLAGNVEASGVALRSAAVLAEKVGAESQSELRLALVRTTTLLALPLINQPG